MWHDQPAFQDSALLFSSSSPFSFTVLFSSFGLPKDYFFPASNSLRPIHSKNQWSYLALKMNAVPAFFLFPSVLTPPPSPLLGVRAKSNQCSVHCLPQSLTWTALLLVLLVPSASWWGHCAILIFMEGATNLPLPYSFWLPACFGLTHPKGPEACQRGLSLPVNMQLFRVHPFKFPVSFGALDIWFAQFFPTSR